MKSDHGHHRLDVYFSGYIIALSEGAGLAPPRWTSSWCRWTRARRAASGRPLTRLAETAVYCDVTLAIGDEELLGLLTYVLHRGLRFRRPLTSAGGDQPSWDWPLGVVRTSLVFTGMITLFPFLLVFTIFIWMLFLLAASSVGQFLSVYLFLFVGRAFFLLPDFVFLSIVVPRMKVS